MGVVSIFPCCPLAVVSLALNVIALIQATREQRWKPIVGLSITVLVILLQVAFVAFSQLYSKH